jgi:type IV pilus biogenesis protein CpaD/CtpE
MSRIALSIILVFALSGLTSCASRPSAEPPAREQAPQWTMATEAEVAAALDLEFEKAAKGFVKLKKNGVLMFCKRYRDIGSNIATIKCITEAQLRTQVENMTKYRDDMRNRAGKCTRGVGCSGG